MNGVMRALVAYALAALARGDSPEAARALRVLQHYAA